MLIAVDFDGTIVEHMCPLIGPPVPGALQWMAQWQEAGAELFLWTVRHGKTLDDAVAYMKESGLPLEHINDHPESSVFGSPKRYAQLYVDDAGFGCPLVEPGDGRRPFVDWEAVGPRVLELVRAHYETH